MKLRARIIWEYAYDVSDDPAERIRLYDTDDAAEMAKLDADNARANPVEFMDMFVFDGKFTVSVEPVDEKEAADV